MKQELGNVFLFFHPYAHNLEKAVAPHSSTLAWKNPMDEGAWWAAVHGVAKSWERLSDFTFTFHFHALEKEIATHSSVLAWRIPGTGEPGGLPSRVAQSRTRLKRLSSSSSMHITMWFPSTQSIVILCASLKVGL